MENRRISLTSTLSKELIVDTVQLMPDWLWTKHQLGTEQAPGSNHTMVTLVERNGSGVERRTLD